MTSTKMMNPRSATWLFLAIFLGIGLVVAVTFTSLMTWRGSAPAGEQAGGEGPKPTSANSDVGKPPRLGSNRWKTIDDLQGDGWESEVWSARAQAQLSILQTGFAGDAGRSSLVDLAAEGFQCGHLLPQNLLTVFRNNSVQVERIQTDPSRAPSIDSQFTGSAGLVSALQSLADVFRGAQDLRAKFKIFHVQHSGTSLTTRQFFSISGNLPEQIIEQHATWTIEWTIPAGESLPRIARITVDAFEQTKSHQSTAIPGTDVAGVG